MAETRQQNSDRSIDLIAVDFDAAAQVCSGSADCDCPLVVYEDESGCYCRHRICEGRACDCGRIVRIEY